MYLFPWACDDCVYVFVRLQVCLCACPCIHVCMYVCIHVHIAFMYTCMHACKYASMYGCMHTHTLYRCTCVRMYTCIHVCMITCIHVSARPHPGGMELLRVKPHLPVPPSRLCKGSVKQSNGGAECCRCVLFLLHAGPRPRRPQSGGVATIHGLLRAGTIPSHVSPVKSRNQT